METYKMENIYIAELYKSKANKPNEYFGQRAILGNTGISIGPNGESQIFRNMFENCAYEILDASKSNIFQINNDLSLRKIGKVGELISLESLLGNVTDIVTNDGDFFENDETFELDGIEDSLSRVLFAFDENNEISKAHLMSLALDIITLNEFDTHYKNEMGSMGNYEEDEDINQDNEKFDFGDADYEDFNM